MKLIPLLAALPMMSLIAFSKLAKEETTIAEAFKADGYATGVFGKDLWPALRDNAASPVESYCWSWHAEDAIRTADWRMHRFFDHVELYDIRSDPGETNNVAAAQPETVKTLTAKMDAWVGSLGAVHSHQAVPARPDAKPAPEGEVLEVTVTVTGRARPKDRILVPFASLEGPHHSAVGGGRGGRERRRRGAVIGKRRAVKASASHFRRRWRRVRAVWVSLCIGSAASAGVARADQTITLDGRKEGRRFDGIGAVSGGGATSRFLIEYPEPQRSQILDYLFTPGFGASLQVLYVEAGSDMNGTQGSEPAHARSREELDHPKPEYFERGYEWWMMKEAKKRNPAIRFDVTAWNAPLWVGKGGGGFWSQDMCDYYVGWIKGAKAHHGLDVRFTGCRNESGVNIPWVKLYRQTLDRAGLTNVTIHGFDNWRPESKWLFAKEFASDPELAKAVGIVSAHTTWKGAPEGPSPSPDYVRDSGKPIWDTEEHVYQDGFPSAINKVRACNENYIDNRVTSTVFWHLASAFYRIEGWYGKHAMIVASSPWCGAYTVMPELWGHAHTCQFTQIGWTYLEGEGCGHLAGGGSYVTYKSPHGADYTVVIETKNAKADQSFAFRIAGGLSGGRVSVWRSEPSAMFARQDDLVPRDGAIALTLRPNAIYTLTTLSGQRKGEHPAPPAEKPFPFPYREDYDHYARAGALPFYQSDIHGVFEVADRPDGGGRCLQAVDRFSNTKTVLDGFTVIGDASWTDYQVSVDVQPGDGGAAALLGRVAETRGKAPKGYILKLAGTGDWTLLAFTNTLASGRAALEDRSWHNLKLVFEGSTIRPFVDDLPLPPVTSTNYPAGMAGLGTFMSTPRFDNLVIGDGSGAPGSRRAVGP